MAFSLFASVRSLGGRRSAPLSCVPTALSSYAAHASYMQVWTTARARETAGVASFESCRALSALAFHWFARLWEDSSLQKDWIAIARKKGTQRAVLKSSHRFLSSLLEGCRTKMRLGLDPHNPVRIARTQAGKQVLRVAPFFRVRTHRDALGQ